jgi:hypothetical protein
MSQLGSFFRRTRRNAPASKKNTAIPRKKSEKIPEKIFVNEEKDFYSFEGVPENFPIPTFFGEHPHTEELFALFQPEAQIYVLYAGNRKKGLLRCQKSDIIRSTDGMDILHFCFPKRRQVLITLPFKQQRDYLFAGNRKGESAITALSSLNIKK